MCLAAVNQAVCHVLQASFLITKLYYDRINIKTFVILTIKTMQSFKRSSVTFREKELLKWSFLSRQYCFLQQSQLFVVSCHQIKRMKFSVIIWWVQSYLEDSIGKNKRRLQSTEQLQNSSWTFWRWEKQADFNRPLQQYWRTQPKIPRRLDILWAWAGRKLVSQHWRAQATTNRIAAKTRQFYW